VTREERGDGEHHQDTASPPATPGPAYRHAFASRSISFHSGARTGITDRRGKRTSGNAASPGRAFSSASVTGRSSRRFGTMSTTTARASQRAVGSGYGSDVA